MKTKKKTKVFRYVIDGDSLEFVADEKQLEECPPNPGGFEFIVRVDSEGYSTIDLGDFPCSLDVLQLFMREVGERLNAESGDQLSVCSSLKDPAAPTRFKKDKGTGYTYSGGN